MNTLKIDSFKESDLHLVAKWRSDERVNRYIRTGRRTLEEVREWFQEQLSGEENRMYLISYDNKPIGYFTIEGIDAENRRCEFGIVIGEPEYHNRGIGVSAIGTMLEKAFGELGMHRIMAVIEEENYASIRCFMKAGFVLEGRLRDASYRNGEFNDLLCFSILEREWKALSKQN